MGTWALRSHQPLVEGTREGRGKSERGLELPPVLVRGGRCGVGGRVKCLGAELGVGDLAQAARNMSYEVGRPGFNPGPPTNWLGDLGLVVPPLASIRPSIEDI